MHEATNGTSIRLIHLADIHLGATSPTAVLTPDGRYQREVDIELSLRDLLRSLRDASPPVDLVVIAGDLFHRATPYPRAVRTAVRMVLELRMLVPMPDVVIVDGNHDTPARQVTGSPLAYLADLGAHVVVEGEPRVLSAEDWENSRLAGHLVLHVVSQHALAAGAVEGVRPVPGMINVLLTHGRVEGMTEGAAPRGSVVPAALLRHPWEYVALGDWHQHGSQPLAGVPAARYAGSLEALTFGEAPAWPRKRGDPYAGRGALDVRLAGPGLPADIRSLSNSRARRVWRLEPIDATGLGPAALQAAIGERLTDPGLQPEDFVALTIERCTTSVWGGLDHAQLETWAGHFRRCVVEPEFLGRAAGDVDEAEAAAPIEDQWAAFAQRVGIDDDERAWLRAEGQALIEGARATLAAAGAGVDR